MSTLGDVVVPLMSAIVGALIGGIFLLCQQRIQRRDEMRAAARAVLSEMFGNAELTRTCAAALPIPLPSTLFTRVTWSEQLPLVAQLLDWNALRKVRGAYDSGTDSFAVTSNQEDRVRLKFARVSKEFLAAIRSFPLDDLLPGKDGKSFELELTEIENRIDALQTDLQNRISNPPAE